MALDIDKMRKKMDDFFNSEEGQASIKKFAEEQEAKEKRHEALVERAYQKYKDNMPAMIEKILAWYDSDTYVKREYGMGLEPRKPLAWLLVSIAAKYGEKVKNTKKDCHKWRQYLNMFTSEAYTYHGYFIQVMHGQGSAVRIDKIDNSRKALKAWKESEEKFKKEMEKYR